MLTEEKSKIKRSKKELRKFGITMAIALAIIGCLILWRQKKYYQVFWGLSSLFLFSGLLLPVILGPVYKLWMTLSSVMGWFMSRVILIILFYLILTPIAILMRILGKDFLNIKFDKGLVESYWIPRELDKSQKKDYEKQF